MKSPLRTFLLVTLTGLYFVQGTAPVAAQASAIGRAAAKSGEIVGDLLRWIGAVGPKALRAGEDADEALADLTKALSRMKSAGRDVSTDVAEALRKNIATLPRCVLRDDELFALASSSSSHCERLFAVAKVHPIENMGARLSRLVVECPEYGDDVLKFLSKVDSEAEGAWILRALSGREVNTKDINLALNACSKATSPNAAGELFEVIARQQSVIGVNRAKLGLKRGSHVLDGKYNRKHGLDGIGVAEDGRPVIMEFTINGKKSLENTGQLSPTSTASGWNKFIEDPARLKQVRELGVREEFLKPVSADTAASFGRKLVAPTDDCLTEANRLAAGLEMDDLVVLGRAN